MNISLKTPSPQDLQELNEPASGPFFVADACRLDQAGVDLQIGGVTVTALFEPCAEFEIARALTVDVHPARPDDRMMPAGYDPDWDETELCFFSPETRAEVYTLDELEYEAWSALEAIAILRERQNTPVSPSEASVPAQESEVARESVEAVEASQNATQPVSEGGWVRPDRIRFDFMWNRDAYYPPRPVEPLTHEEVAARFDGFVTGAAA